MVDDDPTDYDEDEGTVLDSMTLGSLYDGIMSTVVAQQLEPSDEKSVDVDYEALLGTEPSPLGMVLGGLVEAEAPSALTKPEKPEPRTLLHEAAALVAQFSSEPEFAGSVCAPLHVRRVIAEVAKHVPPVKLGTIPNEVCKMLQARYSSDGDATDPALWRYGKHLFTDTSEENCQLTDSNSSDPDDATRRWWETALGSIMRHESRKSITSNSTDFQLSPWDLVAISVPACELCYGSLLKSRAKVKKVLGLFPQRKLPPSALDLLKQHGPKVERFCLDGRLLARQDMHQAVAHLSNVSHLHLQRMTDEAVAQLLTSPTLSPLLRGITQLRVVHSLVHAKLLCNLIRCTVCCEVAWSEEEEWLANNEELLARSACSDEIDEFFGFASGGHRTPPQTPPVAHLTSKPASPQFADLADDDDASIDSDGMAFLYSTLGPEAEDMYGPTRRSSGPPKRKRSLSMDGEPSLPAKKRLCGRKSSQTTCMDSLRLCGVPLAPLVLRDVAEAIKTCSKLQLVELSHNESAQDVLGGTSDHAFSPFDVIAEAVAKRCSSAEEHEGIHQLLVTGNRVGDSFASCLTGAAAVAGIKRVRKGLCSARILFAGLRLLDVSHNEITRLDVRLLEGLQELDASKNPLHTLALPANLTTLQVTLTEMTLDDIALSISEAGISSLRHLHADGCKLAASKPSLADTGCLEALRGKDVNTPFIKPSDAALALLLTSNADTLTHLSLRSCGLQSEHAELLQRVLPSTQIQSLRLAGNVGLFRLVPRVVNCRHLKHLDLSFMPLTPAQLQCSVPPEAKRDDKVQVRVGPPSLLPPGWRDTIPSNLLAVADFSLCSLLDTVYETGTVHHQYDIDA
ncbi:hypothetical protein DIPPA_00397 [Diplonema papillatum]|nr:hypothetical protein DIPPA_00397 [Diplonema papillatum]